MRDIVIVSAVRTPVGRAFKGTLRTTRPDELAAIAIKGALELVPQLDPKEIEDVILGCAMPEGEQGMNVARIASLRAGLPEEVSALTINRFCSSGLQSIAMAAERIMAGGAEVDRGGRNGVDVDDSDGRQQDFAEPVAGRKPSRRLPLDGLDRRARGAALRNHARAERRVFAAQPSEGYWPRFKRANSRTKPSRYRSASRRMETARARPEANPCPGMKLFSRSMRDHARTRRWRHCSH